MRDFTTARPAEPGFYRAECPTTHREYIGAVRLRTKAAGRPVVALVCACCDAHLHTRNLDVLNPQFHMYFEDSDAV